MSIHSFVVEDAVLYGVEKATIIHNLRFWLDKNKANDRHSYDGFFWTYNSASAFHDLFPYMSKQKISRHLRDLESMEFVKSGNFNKAGYDKTKWYTIPKEYCLNPHKDSCFNYELSNVQIQTIDSSDLNNGMFNFEQPIPDSKPDIKTDSKQKTLNNDEFLIKITEYWNELMTTQPKVDLLDGTTASKDRIKAINKIKKEYPDYKDPEYFQGYFYRLSTLKDFDWHRTKKQVKFSQAVNLTKFAENLDIMRMSETA